MTKSEAAAAQARCDAACAASVDQPPGTWLLASDAVIKAVLRVPTDLPAALVDRSALIAAGNKMLNAPYPGDYKDNSDDANEYRIARIRMRELLLSLGELE